MAYDTKQSSSLTHSQFNGNRSSMVAPGRDVMGGGGGGIGAAELLGLAHINEAERVAAASVGLLPPGVGLGPATAAPTLQPPYPFQHGDFVSRLLAATPPYLYNNMSPLWSGVSFSDLLKSLVGQQQTKAAESAAAAAAAASATTGEHPPSRASSQVGSAGSSSSSSGYHSSTAQQQQQHLPHDQHSSAPGTSAMSTPWGASPDKALSIGTGGIGNKSMSSSSLSPKVKRNRPCSPPTQQHQHDQLSIPAAAGGGGDGGGGLYGSGGQSSSKYPNLDRKISSSPSSSSTNSSGGGAAKVNGASTAAAAESKASQLFSIPSLLHMNNNSSNRNSTSSTSNSNNINVSAASGASSHGSKRDLASTRDSSAAAAASSLAAAAAGMGSLSGMGAGMGLPSHLMHPSFFPHLKTGPFPPQFPLPFAPPWGFPHPIPPPGLVSPHLNPAAASHLPPQFDPLHFFLDLRVSGRFWDQKWMHPDLLGNPAAGGSNAGGIPGLPSLAGDTASAAAANGMNSALLEQAALYSKALQQASMASANSAAEYMKSDSQLREISQSPELPQQKAKSSAEKLTPSALNSLRSGLGCGIGSAAVGQQPQQSRSGEQKTVSAFTVPEPRILNFLASQGAMGAALAAAAAASGGVDIQPQNLVKSENGSSNSSICSSVSQGGGGVGGGKKRGASPTNQQRKYGGKVARHWSADESDDESWSQGGCRRVAPNTKYVLKNLARIYDGVKMISVTKEEEDDEDEGVVADDDQQRQHQLGGGSATAALIEMAKDLSSKRRNSNGSIVSRHSSSNETGSDSTVSKDMDESRFVSVDSPPPPTPTAPLPDNEQQQPQQGDTPPPPMQPQQQQQQQPGGDGDSGAGQSKPISNEKALNFESSSVATLSVGTTLTPMIRNTNNNNIGYKNRQHTLMASIKEEAAAAVNDHYKLSQVDTEVVVQVKSETPPLVPPPWS